MVARLSLSFDLGFSQITPPSPISRRRPVTSDGLSMKAIDVVRTGHFVSFPTKDLRHSTSSPQVTLESEFRTLRASRHPGQVLVAWYRWPFVAETPTSTCVYDRQTAWTRSPLFAPPPPVVETPFRTFAKNLTPNPFSSTLSCLSCTLFPCPRHIGHHSPPIFQCVFSKNTRERHACVFPASLSPPLSRRTVTDK